MRFVPSLHIDYADGDCENIDLTAEPADAALIAEVARYLNRQRRHWFSCGMGAGKFLEGHEDATLWLHRTKDRLHALAWQMDPTLKP